MRLESRPRTLLPGRTTSHGHWDHAGGLTRALDLIVNAKGFHENNDGLHADQDTIIIIMIKQNSIF